MDSDKQFFVIGNQYENRKGIYIVLQIKADSMLIEYSDGVQQKIHNMELQERIVKHVREEKDGISLKKGTEIKPHTAQNEQSAFYLEEVFPVIVEVIMEQSRYSLDYVTHEDIVTGLIKHQTGTLLIKIAQERRTKDRRPQQTDENIASNMVAWFSQKYTEGQNEWQERFERKRVNNAWAYCPKAS